MKRSSRLTPKFTQKVATSFASGAKKLPRAVFSGHYISFSRFTYASGIVQSSDAIINQVICHFAFEDVKIYKIYKLLGVHFNT